MLKSYWGIQAFRVCTRTLVMVAVASMLLACTSAKNKTEEDPDALVAEKVEGPKPKIVINGGLKSLRDNVRRYITIDDEVCTVRPWRLRGRLGQTAKEIRAAGQALGYYDLAYEAKLTHGEECWGLELSLTPNEAVKVTELNISIVGEGEQDSIFRSVLQNPGIKLGNRLNHDRYEKIKSNIISQAATHGYFDGQFVVNVVEVNTAEKTAIINLVYDSGRRYRVGEIFLRHNILSEDFLQRFITIDEGDPYDAEELLNIKTQLNASGYFAAVAVSPNLQKLGNGTVPIDIILEERKRRAYSAGIGEGTDTGPRILLGYEDRYVNQRGHSFAAYINTSEVKSNSNLVYTIPMDRPGQEFWKIYSGYEYEQTDTTSSAKWVYGTSYSKLRDNGWLQTYALNYEDEDSELGDGNNFSTYLFIPSFTLSRIKTDGSPYPEKGWSLLGRLSGSPSSLGSDFSFSQLYLRGKYIHSFSRYRALIRGEIGTTNTDGLSQLPASIRYFAGGDHSVRGYGYETLGTKNQSGEVIGGRHLVTTSLEIDHRIRESNWVAAVFMDMGNAVDDVDNIDWHRGVGVGARWISPIGPIRLDLAKALDGNGSFRVHISMGPDL